MMIGSHAQRVLSVAGSVLLIPLTCTLAAQFMQHVYATDFEAANMSTYGPHSPLLLFSFLKIVAIVVLSLTFARFLVSDRQLWHGGLEAARADRALGFIVALNLGIALLVLLALMFINSEGFTPLHERGVTKSAAKIAVLAAVFALMAPLNKRVFRDVSRAIGSAATCRAELAFSGDPNRVFLKRFTRNLARYVLPAFVVHAAITFGMPPSGALFYAQAAADSIVLAILGLCAGYAIFISHEETLASAA